MAGIVRTARTAGGRFGGLPGPCGGLDPDGRTAPQILTSRSRPLTRTEVFGVPPASSPAVIPPAPRTPWDGTGRRSAGPPAPRQHRRGHLQVVTVSDLDVA